MGDLFTVIQAGLAFWTAGLFSLPVDLKARQIKPHALLELPAMIPCGRSQQLNAIGAATFDQPLGFNIAAIYQLCIWQQLRLLQGLLDRRERIIVTGGGGLGVDVGNDVRQVILTALGQVYLIAEPGQTTLL